jgi:N utilization substance protein B
MATRREARERALGLSYELDVRGLSVDQLLAELPSAPEEYAVDLLRGVDAHWAEVDTLLARYSEHWAVERMPLVDRSVLRIGCYELGWQLELPTGVVISEAVELAKQYSTKDSGRFVNGLLGRIAEDLRAPQSL